MCFLRDWINALFAEKYQLINLCNKILASDMENPCRRLILYVIALPHSVVGKCALTGKKKPLAVVVCLSNIVLQKLSFINPTHTISGFAFLHIFAPIPSENG